MTFLKTTFVFFAVLILATVLSVNLSAQNSLTGEISGTVTDPSGAVVSGATITAVSASTDVKQTATTNNSGAFRFAFVKPDTYRLTVTHEGFRSSTETLAVNVGAIATANLKLEVGQTSETLEVTAAEPVIQTENANLTTTYNSAQVENLPNGGNDITNYAQTAPGVLMNSSSGGGYGNFTAFGLPATSNLFTVNGNDEMDPYLNLNNSGATNLLLGANEVEEVGVTSNGYTGQYGRMAGAQVNYTTKSGGNSFHGSMKYYYNDVSLNANDWFLNNTNTKPGFDVNNQYAAAIGGPIVKDKLFFFIGTEGLRYVLATSNQIFVPTKAFENAVITNLPVFGPTATGATAASVPFYQNLFSLFDNAPGAAAGVPDLQPGYGCGDINTFDPTTGNAGPQPGFTQFGDPTTTGGPGGLPCANVYRSTVGALSTEWLMYAKVDWVHSNNDKWSIRMKTDHGQQPTYIDFLTPTFNAVSIQPQWEGQLTNTHVINNNVINQFTGSVFWYSAIFRQSNASAASTLLPYAIYSFDAPFGNPNTGVMAGGEQNVFPQGRNVTQWQLVDDVSIDKGNHGLKFGVNFRRDDITDATFGVRTIPRARIFSTTDFVSGFIDQFSQRFPQNLEERINMYSIGFYGQDEWKVTPKLKLTLTMRLDRNSNATCPGHCFSRFATQFSELNHDPTIPFNQGIKTNLTTAFSSIQAINAQPRIGFAYSITPSTVIRGGGGMFTDLYPGTLVDNYAAQAPFDPTFTISGLLSPAEGSSSAGATAGGCNSTFQTVYAGGGTVADYKSGAPAGCNVPDYHDVVNHVKNPTYVEYNLELQQAIGSRSAVSINYVGNRGYDEFLYNDLVNAYQKSGASGLPTAVPDSRVRNVQGLSNGGFSNYNGLTAAFTQRAFHGLQFSANYTFSHSLDVVSNGGVLPYSFNDSLGPVANPYLPRALNYSNADYDVRHNFNANYVWQVPGGHHQGFMNQVLGGWIVSGTFFARSGLPFTVIDTGLGFSNGTGFAVGYSPLPSFLGGNQGCGGHNQDPNASCLTAAQFNSTTSNFGQTRRNFFRGPHFFNSDLSVLKGFKVTERLGFAIGANAYNVFNHPNFGNPNHDLSGGSFGTSATTVEPPTSPYGAFVGSAVSGRVLQLHAELKF